MSGLPALLLASNRPGATENGPRVDFLELARVLDAPLDYPPPKGSDLISRIEQKTASDWRQAWHAQRRRDVGIFVSLSEKVGIPLALLSRRPHVLIGHALTSSRKRSLQQRTGFLHRFAAIIVLCRTQERYLFEEVGLPRERVHFVYDKVDSHFWTPTATASGAQPSVLAVGKEQRDYATLIEAAHCLPSVTFYIIASSPWSRNTATNDSGLPANVHYGQGLSWQELYTLYGQATLVMVPLLAGTDYAAGVNAVLEAMSMAKPLIVTATPGIVDYIDAGKTGVTVPPTDPNAIVAAITRLLNHPQEADALGQAAHAVVQSGRNLDTYVSRIAEIVREVRPS